MAKAATIPGLAPETRFGDAAATAVETRAREVFAHAEGVLDTADIERVHDMRVATRRLRAAMEVFAVCFPAREHAKLLKEVKRLADALGERRDPDVAIEELEGIAAELGASYEDGEAARLDSPVDAPYPSSQSAQIKGNSASGGPHVHPSPLQHSRAHSSHRSRMQEQKYGSTRGRICRGVAGGRRSGAGDQRRP